ncbi:ankyrin [Annulohypoxylon bovei var. microspora]|nr:ankyrin [Annulohypoxylon bovei var. microspora]
MEAIGAVASFVAIGQALAATPKIIDILRSVVEARQELLQLINDVEILNSLGASITKTMSNLDDESKDKFQIPQSSLLLVERVRVDLASVVLDLEELARKCQRRRNGNSQIKVARIKWFQRRNQIASLSERARKNCNDLQIIMSLTSFSALTAHGNMLMEIHKVVVVSQAHSHGPQLSPLQLTSQPRYIGGMVSHTVDTNDKHSVFEDIGTQLESSDQSSLPSAIVETSLRSFPNERIIHETVVQLTAMLPRACAKGCQCQCHSPMSRTRPHPAVSPIYGWLKSAYNVIPRLGTQRCDTPTCRRTYSPVHVNLRIPLLFCSRALEASLSFSSVVGVGASLHLHVARMVLDTEIWAELGFGKIDQVHLRLFRREISPIDFNQVVSFIESAVQFGQYEILALLLQESASILRGTGLAKRLACLVRNKIYRQVPENVENLLQQVIALDEDTDDYWPIHEAIRGGGDLAAILRESSEGINSLDNFGRTPLHWAVECSDSTAIQHLISHGANPDIRDMWEYTPLMRAANDGEHGCVQVLINSKCDINMTQSDGWTALTYAIISQMKGPAEIINLLLDNGAILNGGCLDSENALHDLAWCSGVAEVVTKFQLLVHAGLEFEQKNKYGYTPLDLALEKNNETMFRLLVDAGCKLDDTPGDNNSLIAASRFAGAEVMDIMDETKFTIDIRLRDSVGDTPLDRVEWRMNALSLPGWFQPPSNDDVEAFKRLLGGVRDRYLSTETRTLETIIGHLEEHNYALARDVLKHVIQEKVKWDIPAEYRTFRAIDVQIKEEMIEAAIESLEEFIEVSRTRIGTDPFVGDYCSRYGLEDQGLIVENAN